MGTTRDATLFFDPGFCLLVAGTWITCSITSPYSIDEILVVVACKLRRSAQIIGLNNASRDYRKQRCGASQFPTWRWIMSRPIFVVYIKVDIAEIGWHLIETG